VRLASGCFGALFHASCSAAHSATAHHAAVHGMYMLQGSSRSSRSMALRSGCCQSHLPALSAWPSPSCTSSWQAVQLLPSTAASWQCAGWVADTSTQQRTCGLFAPAHPICIGGTRLTCSPSCDVQYAPRVVFKIALVCRTSNLCMCCAAGHHLFLSAAPPVLTTSSGA
jgi:hypothetical protein